MLSLDAGMPEMNEKIRTLYATATVDLRDDILVTILHIGKEDVVVATGNGTMPLNAMVLELGAARIARDLFRHEPPAPYEMENAIMVIETALIRARPLIMDNSMLLTSDTVIRRIARFASLPEGGGAILTIGQVEQAFERIAAVTLGRPASSDNVPTDPAFSAALLILREFMHHLQFSSIRLISGPVGPAGDCAGG